MVKKSKKFVAKQKKIVNSKQAAGHNKIDNKNVNVVKVHIDNTKKIVRSHKSSKSAVNNNAAASSYIPSYTPVYIQSSTPQVDNAQYKYTVDYKHPIQNTNSLTTPAKITSGTITQDIPDPSSYQKPTMYSHTPTTEQREADESARNFWINKMRSSITHQSPPANSLTEDFNYATVFNPDENVFDKNPSVVDKPIPKEIIEESKKRGRPKKYPSETTGEKKG